MSIKNTMWCFHGNMVYRVKPYTSVHLHFTGMCAHLTKPHSLLPLRDETIWGHVSHGFANNFMLPTCMYMITCLSALISKLKLPRCDDPGFCLLYNTLAGYKPNCIHEEMCVIWPNIVTTGHKSKLYRYDSMYGNTSQAFTLDLALLFL